MSLYGTKRDKAEFISKTQRVPRYLSTRGSGATGATLLHLKVGTYPPTNLSKPSYIGKRRKIDE